jgi:tRNA(fMet)-specific endonuclease VapC
VKKILLDTNAYTQLLAGREAVLDIISAAGTLYMSIFVLGELYSGFGGGSKEQENKEILNRFLLKPTVKILNATLETADVFGMLKSRLKAAGTLLPINDVWLAAHAIETGSVLISFDKHFNKVSGLRLWDQAGKLEMRG